MSRRILYICVALTATLIESHPDPALGYFGGGIHGGGLGGGIHVGGGNFGGAVHFGGSSFRSSGVGASHPSTSFGQSRLGQPAFRNPATFSHVTLGRPAAASSGHVGNTAHSAGSQGGAHFGIGSFFSWNSTPVNVGSHPPQSVPTPRMSFAARHGSPVFKGTSAGSVGNAGGLTGNASSAGLANGGGTSGGGLLLENERPGDISGSDDEYPGAVFGYTPDYLWSRTVSATGGFGSLSYGTPQTTTNSTSAAISSAPTSASAATLAATEATGEKIVKGEAAFRAEDYDGAINDWRQVLADGHSDPLVQMMLGQAYFAAGHYRKATVATQSAMHALPQAQWYVVIKNRQELYDGTMAYSTQLQKLEAAVEQKPDNPAVRFLLGYHYAGLDYPQAAVDQLDKVIALEPRDEMAVKLRDVLLGSLPNREAPVIIPGRSTSPGE